MPETECSICTYGPPKESRRETEEKLAAAREKWRIGTSLMNEAEREIADLLGRLGR
jgi:hypothetical protein